MSSHTLPTWSIRLLAAPALLYDWDAGWLLGRRFLRLTHAGRRSGRVYRTMLESVGEQRSARELFVVAGLGRSAQWYRNVRAGHALEIAIARERFRPAYREVEPAEAVGVLAAYEERNRLIAPALRLVLSRLVGWRYDSTAAARQRLVSELPMIAFRPAT
jgi:deazaflavin-dependent oxidoreductase (nitroreductase family)